MATYADWNNAIARYFTSNVPSGTGIFLTLHDDSLFEIATNFLSGQLGRQCATEDFINAVRNKVVLNNAVSFERIRNENTGDCPSGVAFIGLMVLAAHRMDNNEEEGINERNYFLRLTRLLEVSSGIGNRPAGMPTGSEQEFWLEWNKWLHKHGWQPTAQAGPEGMRKYLNYVLTQALVRDGDKSYLQARFLQNIGAYGISRNMDESQLAGWLQRTNSIARRYLRDGFRSSDPQRAVAFYEAAYRVFQSTPWDGGQFEATIQRSRVINAGLFRSVSISGQIAYKMFVPQPTNWIPKPLAICLNKEQKISLEPYRIGHFKQLNKQIPFVPDSICYCLEGDPLLDAVVFPKRDFWILTTDPEDPSGAFATWEKFPNLLGLKFTLLCSIEGEQFVQDEMDKFREAKLIDWDNGPTTVSGMPVHEYRGCMILSAAWDGVVPSEKCLGLYEALKPKQFATISLSGGIRAPYKNAWLVGNPPVVKIYGFEEEFGLKLLCGEDQKLYCSQSRQQALQLDSSLAAGLYTLEVELNDQLLATRCFRLLNWEDLESTDKQTSPNLIITSSDRSFWVSGPLFGEVENGEE